MASRLSALSPQLRRDRRAGFALLMTITLLAFLVVLLIGLAAYTRIETAIASNTQRQSQARQNALLGLNIALAQLQKYAGPDQRVTATGQAFGGAGARNYTGVWSTAPASAAGPTPLTWLVSGSEKPNATTDGLLTAALDPTTDATAAQEFLIGDKTVSDKTERVKLTKQDITTIGVPGTTGTTPVTIGRYAWWVGDQGVKAPVALADPTTVAANFDYEPYSSSELRSRIRQQISLGAGAADSTGAVFEPRDTTGTTASPSNAVLAGNTVSSNQIAFFKKLSGTVGLAALQQNFHRWSPNNFAVLANTKLGGLRQDLSLDPTLLGPSFAAWANYDPKNGGYMEDPTAPIDPTPLQPYSTDPLRRRYVMQGGGALSVAPVLTYSLLSFNVRTQDSSTAVRPIEVRTRWMFTLWNPYTSALVPENLRLEISGLPSVTVDDETTGTAPPPFSLHAVFGSPLKIRLPWESSTSSSVPSDDRQSWLPGRVYSWTSLEDTTGIVSATGYSTNFYSHNLNADAGDGVQHLAPGSATVDGDDICHIDGNAAILRFTLVAERASGDVTLATFTSPRFESFRSKSQELSKKSYQFSYLLRLGESRDTPETPELWLTTQGRDPHQNALSAESFVPGPNGPRPELYDDYTAINDTDRLLDRATDRYTFDEDTPLFELPRAPILSLGMLQHLAIPGQRPFAIGNSWSMDPAAPVQLNGTNLSELFDRFFFSGLVTNLAPGTVGASLQLPNPLLKPLPRNSATSLPVTLTDLQSAPMAQTSKFLMQGGAFNVNSVDPLAWTAVLRAQRFPAPSAFNYLDADAATGTAADDAVASIQSSDAQFFRFSQSAQETYKAEPGNSGGLAATELFRRGMITVKADILSLLATKITDAIKARQATIGPFRSIEEFLAPTLPGSPSLLEQAISDAGVNAAVAEFSSQFLTQADIMTALAPVLFPRSDTFVIRSYGEAINPTTGANEGRAWCEATVQRVPDYFDPTNPPELPPTDPALTDINHALGRRFKIVSFRWLTRSDI